MYFLTKKENEQINNSIHSTILLPYYYPINQRAQKVWECS